jgi:hypothetical protein
VSVWAKGWAYEQRCGGLREDGRYKGRYKGNPGAKAVLIAIAEFADENGVCIAGQDTIADMCDMEVRTVREHMAHLEDNLKLIERGERRRRDGSRTSDQTRLLAPAERLRAPSSSGARKAAEQPENSSGSQAEKNSGSEEPTGKETQANRKRNATSPEKFSGPSIEEPSGEPSGEPSVVAREASFERSYEVDHGLPDDTTVYCLLLLKRVRGFPRNQAENALFLGELRVEFPKVDARNVVRQYEIWHRDNPGKTKNYRGRLRSFFEKANKDLKDRPEVTGTPPMAAGEANPQGQASPEAVVEALRNYDNDGRTDLRQFAFVAQRWDFTLEEPPPFKILARLGANEEERMRNLDRIRSVARKAKRSSEGAA